MSCSFSSLVSGIAPSVCSTVSCSKFSHLRAFSSESIFACLRYVRLSCHHGWNSPGINECATISESINESTDQAINIPHAVSFFLRAYMRHTWSAPYTPTETAGSQSPLPVKKKNVVKSVRITTHSPGSDFIARSLTSRPHSIQNRSVNQPFRSQNVPNVLQCCRCMFSSKSRHRRWHWHPRTRAPC